MPRTSFEKFYFEKVALGEGCGCAEQIIGTRDIDAQSRADMVRREAAEESGGRLAWLGRLFSRKGSQA